MTWTFKQTMDEVCMNLNELAAAGSAIEVTFYDTEFDEDDEQSGAESRDDFVVLFRWTQSRGDHASAA